MMQVLQDVEVLPGALVLLGAGAAGAYSLRAPRSGSKDTSGIAAALTRVWLVVRGLVYYVLSGVLIMMSMIYIVAFLRIPALTKLFEEWGALAITVGNGVLYGYLILRTRPSSGEQKQRKKS